MTEETTNAIYKLNTNINKLRKDIESSIKDNRTRFITITGGYY